MFKLDKVTTVKPVIVATSNKQATCVKKPWVKFLKETNNKKIPVLNKHLS